LKKYGEVLYDP